MHDEHPGPDPLGAVAWPRTTDRLLIRRVRPADAEAMWAYRGPAEFSHWAGWRPRDRGDWRQALHRRAGAMLATEHQGRVVGDLTIAIRDGRAQREAAAGARGSEAELAWALDPALGGKGLATEAVRELLRVCFDDLGLRRVTAEAFVANDASWRLMERVGMRREFHAVGSYLHRDLGWLDSVGYALLDSEWTTRGETPNPH